MGPFPEWTWVVGLFLGATIGSFLNMLIYRLPRMGPEVKDLSLTKPSHSICPSCKHRLGPLDLMPLFSWLFQGGKCRYCKAKIGARYFVVELVTGALWAGIWYQYLCVTDQPLKACFYMAAMAALVTLTWIDWESYTIPDAVNIFILLLGFGFHIANGTIMVAVTGAFAGWAILWGIGFLGRVLFGKDAMGEGDIMLMRGVGALIGVGPLIIAVAIAVFLGALHGILVMIFGRKAKQANAGSDEEMPPPQTIGQNLLIGGLILCCVDVIAFFVPPVSRALEKALPNEAGLSDEGWTPPSLNYIPFGPFLAAGTAFVLLWEAWVKQVIDGYVKQLGGS